MSEYNLDYMKMAYFSSRRSIDPSKKVGAVAIINDGIIVSSYNRFVSGVAETHERYTNKELKYKYVIHAEARMIYTAYESNQSLYGSTLYVYGLGVCTECAKALIEVGVKNVYSMGIISDRWKKSIEDAKSIFDEVGVKYTHFNDELIWE
jgi:dCMP deaminase